MSVDWDSALRDLRTYLKLERSLSDRTITAYLTDLAKLRAYAERLVPPRSPDQLDLEDLQHFLTTIASGGSSARSQARLLSAVRGLYRSLRLDGTLKNDPSELLESPRLGRHLPEFLSVEEIDAIVRAIDMSRPMAHRDRAMIETLYGCGLRVSELCGLRISRVHATEGFVRVVGKGDKERLVPISPEALHWMDLYRSGERAHLQVRPSDADILFLNARGGGSPVLPCSHW